ncbi:MAG: tRNA-dihydrouridine synthase, partial [Candidatus Saccharimonas aalborgensis]
AKQRAGDDASGDQHDKLIELLRFHLDEYDRYYQQTSRPFETLKRFFKIYIRDFDGASDLRVELMNCTTTEEVRSILDRQVC